MTSVFKCMM